MSSEVPRLARPFVALLVAAMVASAIFVWEPWPLTSFRLFSHVRHDEQTAWEATAVAPDGEELDYAVAAQSRGLRGFGFAMAEFAAAGPGRQDELCRAWLEAAPDAVGEDVTEVRLYWRSWKLSERSERAGSRGHPPAPLHLHRRRRRPDRGSAGMRPLRAIDRFVFAPEDARRLAAIRIGLFGVLAFRLATNGDYADVAGQPQALFDPVSLFHLLESMPSPALTTALQVAGVVAAAIAAAGLWPRISFPTAFAIALFLNLMLNATGKIIHNDVVLMLCLLPLLASPRAAATAWALRIPRRRDSAPADRLVGVAYGWPVRTAMVVIGLAYLIVGLQKLRYSGLDWATTENLRWVLYASSDSQADPNAIALFVADRAWLVHLFAAGTIVVEVGFILCLPFARLRWLFVPAAVSLHLGIWIAMGLDYSAQILAVIIVFVNWVPVVGWLQRLSVSTPVRT